MEASSTQDVGSISPAALGKLLSGVSRMKTRVSDEKLLSIVEGGLLNQQRQGKSQEQSPETQGAPISSIPADRRNPGRSTAPAE